MSYLKNKPTTSYMSGLDLNFIDMPGLNLQKLNPTQHTPPPIIY